MSYAHDIGGMQAGPIDVDDNVEFHDAWETKVFAMMRALVYNEVFTLDEFRDAVERMEPTAYLGASYFHRWLDAIERLSIEKGVLTRAELESIAPSPKKGRVPFTAGRRVRTRLNVSNGHTRLPDYARGRVGTVHRHRGDYRLPDELVVHGHSDPQGLYSVYFEARDLWGEGAGNHRVYLDLYESYLQPLEAEMS